MTSTFSIPIRRISSATKTAARRTSSLCSGAVLTLGMRSRSFNSPRNFCWFSFAKVTADEAMRVSPGSGIQNLRVYRVAEREHLRVQLKDEKHALDLGRWLWVDGARLP